MIQYACENNFTTPLLYYFELKNIKCVSLTKQRDTFSITETFYKFIETLYYHPENGTTSHVPRQEV